MQHIRIIYHPLYFSTSVWYDTNAPSNPGMIYYTTAYVAGYVPNDKNRCGYRFCINLKNMFK